MFLSPEDDFVPGQKGHRTEAKTKIDNKLSSPWINEPVTKNDGQFSTISDKYV